MSLLKIIPAIIALGTVAVATGVVTELIISDDDDYVEDENTKKEVLGKLKRLQNELARLTDLKMLNDRREATSQVKSVDLMVDGIEINELISTLEADLYRLTSIYSKF